MGNSRKRESCEGKWREELGECEKGGSGRKKVWPQRGLGGEGRVRESELRCWPTSKVNLWLSKVTLKTGDVDVVDDNCCHFLSGRRPSRSLRRTFLSYRFVRLLEHDVPPRRDRGADEAVRRTEAGNFRTPEEGSGVHPAALHGELHPVHSPGRWWPSEGLHVGRRRWRSLRDEAGRVQHHQDCRGQPGEWQVKMFSRMYEYGKPKLGCQCQTRGRKVTVIAVVVFQSPVLWL